MARLAWWRNAAAAKKVSRGLRFVRGDFGRVLETVREMDKVHYMKALPFARRGFSWLPYAALTASGLPAFAFGWFAFVRKRLSV